MKSKSGTVQPWLHDKSCAGKDTVPLTVHRVIGYKMQVGVAWHTALSWQQTFLELCVVCLFKVLVKGQFSMNFLLLWLVSLKLRSMFRAERNAQQTKRLDWQPIWGLKWRTRCLYEKQCYSRWLKNQILQKYSIWIREYKLNKRLIPKRFFSFVFR